MDIEPDMVRYLGERARREELGNLVAVLGKADDPLLPEPVDLAFVANTYHHIQARAAWLQRLKTCLAPGGRVAVVDFCPASRRGPPPQHKLAPTQVSHELEAAGFRLVAPRRGVNWGSSGALRPAHAG